MRKTLSIILTLIFLMMFMTSCGINTVSTVQGGESAASELALQQDLPEIPDCCGG